jgi:hypothetical protein
MSDLRLAGNAYARIPDLNGHLRLKTLSTTSRVDEYKSDLLHVIRHLA